MRAWPCSSLWIGSTQRSSCMVEAVLPTQHPEPRQILRRPASYRAAIAQRVPPPACRDARVQHWTVRRKALRREGGGFGVTEYAALLPPYDVARNHRRRAGMGGPRRGWSTCAGMAMEGVVAVTPHPANARSTASGSVAITRSSTRAGPVGWRWPCS